MELIVELADTNGTEGATLVRRLLRKVRADAAVFVVTPVFASADTEWSAFFSVRPPPSVSREELQVIGAKLEAEPTVRRANVPPLRELVSRTF